MDWGNRERLGALRKRGLGGTGKLGEFVVGELGTQGGLGGDWGGAGAGRNWAEGAGILGGTEGNWGNVDGAAGLRLGELGEIRWGEQWGMGKGKLGQFGPGEWEGTGVWPGLGLGALGRGWDGGPGGRRGRFGVLGCLEGAGAQLGSDSHVPQLGCHCGDPGVPPTGFRQPFASSSTTQRLPPETGRGGRRREGVSRAPYEPLETPLAPTVVPPHAPRPPQRPPGAPHAR